jgi:hypothetical protein
VEAKLSHLQQEKTKLETEWATMKLTFDQQQKHIMNKEIELEIKEQERIEMVTKKIEEERIKAEEERKARQEEDAKWLESERKIIQEEKRLFEEERAQTKVCTTTSIAIVLEILCATLQQTICDRLLQCCIQNLQYNLDVITTVLDTLISKKK